MQNEYEKVDDEQTYAVRLQGAEDHVERLP